jgi:hypothetical protein
MVSFRLRRRHDELEMSISVRRTLLLPIVLLIWLTAPQDGARGPITSRDTCMVQLSLHVSARGCTASNASYVATGQRPRHVG